MQSTHSTGIKGEDYVCTTLRKRGFIILDRNVREKFAEIDIVAEDGETLCFIEVRTRRNTTLGHPSETITPAKKRLIRRAAEAYLVRRHVAPRPIRFDVATIVWSSMEFQYFENAF
ncbi:MAG: YraN family protein [Proteobacteria bacterium]|nr:YraN family protein [Pseudomonadota bacterium]